MIEALTVIALFAGTFAFIGLGIHFGSKYIDRMLRPPVVFATPHSAATWREKMDDKVIRLECIRCAGGDVKKAQELYEFMMGGTPTKPVEQAKAA